VAIFGAALDQIANVMVEGSNPFARSSFLKTGSPEVREVLAACAGASFMLS
jgi:hypothetical protein